MDNKVIDLFVAIAQQESFSPEEGNDFLAIAESAKEGILVNQYGKHVYVNKSIAELLGYTLDELIGTSMQDVVHPDEYESVSARFRERSQGKAVPVQYDTYFITKSREKVPVELTVSMTTWLDDVAGVAFIRDITPRKKIEYALAESELWLKGIFGSLDEGILVATLDRVFINVNHAAHRILGYSDGEIIGCSTKIVHVDDDHYLEFGKKIKETFDKGVMSKFEFELLTKQGKVIPSEHTLSVIRNDKNEAVGIVGTISDITKRKRAEKELYDYRNRLEELVKERTAELSEVNKKLRHEMSEREQAEVERKKLSDQLQQAQKMEAMGQLTGGIAHDFNNILTSIVGYNNLARDRSVNIEDKKIKKYLDEVNLAGERARDLISQLLVFSRGEKIKPQAQHLEKLTKEVVQMLAVTMPSTIQVDTQVVDDLPMAMIDPIQLQQIIINLCINARDAMEGIGRLTLRLHKISVTETVCSSCHETFSGSYIELAVEDTGHGLLPGQMQHLFEPFYTTKAIGKGTGLGLSVAHGLIHDLTGHIVVNSVQGEGSTFRLLLPVADKVTTQYTLENEVIENFLLAQEEDAPHVLVVDDEVSVAGYIHELFKSKGYRVTTIIDSEDALAKFTIAPHEFDLLVTDYTMPGMTGMELAKAILLVRPGFPIILCTGYSEKISEACAIENGLSGYLRKPIDTQSLFKQVQCLLKKKTNSNERESVMSVDG